MQVATQMAEQLPFFDLIDRQDLARFSQDFNELSRSSNIMNSQVLELSQDLGAFLADHETIDDRERDRDYFIVSRVLSRNLSLSSPDRQSIDKTFDRLLQFVQQRQKRWAARISRLDDDNKPDRHESIAQKRVFEQKIREAIVLFEQAQYEKSVASLGVLSGEYKAWIEELEAKEDEQQKRRQQASQQAANQVQEKLRELQRVQDGVSRKLDKASERDQGELKKSWGAVQSAQSENATESTQLLKMLQMMSPRGADRLKAAVASMQDVVVQGNTSSFALAESASDLASRLLRDAAHLAQKQQEKASRGKRKRPSGDNYFGKSIDGGDIEIKRQYSVDPRYREQVLDDVQSELFQGTDQSVLDSYLRETLR
jgi:hypothetical protein